MKVGIPGTAESTGTLTPSSIKIIIVALETQVVATTGSRVLTPVALEDKIINRSVWAPGITILTARWCRGTASGI